jgi:hypothetical protein
MPCIAKDAEAPCWQLDMDIDDVGYGLVVAV